MADEELDFVVHVGDEASDAFRDIARQVGLAEREFEKLEKGVSKAEREMQRAARESEREAKRVAREKTKADREFTNARLAMFRLRERQTAQESRDEKRAAKERERLSRERVRDLEKIQGKYSSVGSAIGTATKLAAGFAIAGVIGAGAAVGVVGNRAMDIESLGLAFKNLTGSQESGAAAFRETEKLSEQLGLRFESTSHSMRELLAAQFSLDESTELIKMVGDLRTIGVEGEKAQRVMTALTQIKAKGRLQAEELMQINEAGISVELINKALMEQLNIDSLPALQSRQQAGKITGNQGISAIKAAVMAKTHEDKLGQAAEEFAATTMSGAVGRLGSAWDKALNQMAKSSMGSFQVINTAAERLIGALDDPRTGEAMTEAFAVISQTVEDLLPDSESLADGLVAAANGFRTFVTLGSEFVRGGMSGFLQGIGVDFNNLSDTSSIEAQKEQFRQFGEQVGEAVAGLAKLLGLLGDIAGTVGSIWSGAGDSSSLLTTPLDQWGSREHAPDKVDGEMRPIHERVAIESNQLREEMRDTGQNMMLGLMGGMSYMGPAVAQSMTEQAQNAHAAFKLANQERSPSRLYFDSGRNNMLGVIGGHKAENDNAMDTTRRLALDMHRAFGDGMSQGAKASIPALPSDRAAGGSARGFAGSPVANYMSSIASSNASTVNNFDITANNTISGAKSPQATSGAVNGGLLDMASMAIRKVG
jgi:hypothetical protein